MSEGISSIIVCQGVRFAMNERGEQVGHKGECPSALVVSRGRIWFVTFHFSRHPDCHRGRMLIT